MKLIIKYLVGVVLGEEDLQFSLDSDTSKSRSSYVKTGYGAGYKVDINGSSVTIRHENKLAVALGWPPFYYFKGAIQEGREEKVVTGRITMKWYPKCFILAWITIIFMALIASVIMTMFLSIEFMVSPSQAIEKHLLTSGFMFGTAASLSVFGGIMISSIKLISLNQKKGLKQFCLSLRKKGGRLFS
jgi:hypothetical protein